MLLQHYVCSFRELKNLNRGKSIVAKMHTLSKPTLHEVMKDCFFSVTGIIWK